MRKLIKMLIKTYRSNCCCLCGSTNQLTHEHKIKASGIKNIFGRDKMLIGTFANADGYRIAQGPKSKEFHFAVPICAACNGSLTQQADLDFDYFHNDLMSLYHRHENINAIINWRIACIPPTAELNMRRYFANYYVAISPKLVVFLYRHCRPSPLASRIYAQLTSILIRTNIIDYLMEKWNHLNLRIMVVSAFWWIHFTDNQPVFKVR